MNWKVACCIALIAWSAYGFFGERAAKVHGDKINMIFETIAFILLALIAAIGGVNDFQKVTTNSAINGSIMGLLSAGGFWFVLYALKIAPQQDTALVLLISGMFPVGAAVISNFVITPLSLMQWIGIALAGFGMVLVNLK
jgi:drug/metabolite transporter (DMT)-like permease